MIGAMLMDRIPLHRRIREESALPESCRSPAVAQGTLLTANQQAQGLKWRLVTIDYPLAPAGGYLLSLIACGR
jgi:hypothetical protein